MLHFNMQQFISYKCDNTVWEDSKNSELWRKNATTVCHAVPFFSYMKKLFCESLLTSIPIIGPITYQALTPGAVAFNL